MIYKELETTPEFRFIKPIMESWTSLYEKTAEAFPQDEKFWIHEPGAVALLCAASWLRGVSALNEAKTRKKGSDRSGRVDILLDTGDIKIAGEAKLDWIYDTRSLNRVVNSLKEARNEASKLPCDLANHRLGILFALFWVKERDANLVEETRRRFKDEDPVGIAWSMTAPKPQQAKKYSPGGFVVFSKPC